MTVLIVLLTKSFIMSTELHIMTSCVWILHIAMVSMASIQQTGICVQNKSITSVHIALTCPNNTMIHVVSENLGDGNTTCLTKEDNCTVVRDSTSKALVVNCNGHQSCFETVLTSYNRCNLTMNAVNAVRNCITGSIDMCAVRDQMTHGPLYLHSPGFPDSVGVNESCNCQINGSNMMVTLLEHYTRGQVLNISSDGSDVWPDPQLLPIQFNTQLAQAAEEVTVSYTNNNTTEDNVWIRITGTGTLKVSCSNITTQITTVRGSSETTTDQTSFTAELSLGSSPSSMSSKSSASIVMQNSTSGAETGESLPLAVMAGSAAAGGVIIIVTVVIVIIVCRRKRKSNDVEANKEFVQMGSLVGTDSTSNQYTELGLELGTPVYDNSAFRDEDTLINGQSRNNSDMNEVYRTPSLVKMSISDTINNTNKTSQSAADDDRLADKECSDVKYDIKDNGKCPMVGHEIYVGGPALTGKYDEEMVDNILYHSYKQSINGDTANQQSETEQSITTEMEEGMIVNDMYHSYISPHISEEPTVPIIHTHDVQEDNNDDGKEEMIINDLYHSYQSSQDFEAADEDLGSHRESEDENHHLHMVDNDLYHSNIITHGDSIP